MRPLFGEWDVEANERFKDLTWDKKLVAKVKYLTLGGEVLHKREISYDDIIISCIPDLFSTP